ncbi:MAG: class I SAM-dependent methyltransferase, partial [Planctomycetota bacterium]
ASADGERPTRFVCSARISVEQGSESFHADKGRVSTFDNQWFTKEWILTLPRVLEPEIGSGDEDAWAYHEMDHAGVNQAFVDALFEGGSVGPRVIDLGCGTAAISILVAQRFERLADTMPNADECKVMGLDLDIAMLEIARRQIEIEGVTDRVSLQHSDLRSISEFESGFADTVVSNTVLHHLPDPDSLIVSAIHLMGGSTGEGGAAGRVFVRDLVRPGSLAEVNALVDLYGADETESAKSLLHQSLRAALTLDEIREIVVGLGIPAAHVQMSSDRHWTLDWSPKSTIV